MKTLTDFFKPLPHHQKARTPKNARSRGRHQDCGNDTNHTKSNGNTSSTSIRTPVQTPTAQIMPTPITPSSTTTPQQSSTLGQTPEIIATTCTGTKRKRNHQQMYLDFGQASFGSRTICPICNAMVVHGLDEDENQHEKICNDYRLGVAFQMKLQNVRVVSSFSARNAIASGNSKATESDRNGGGGIGNVFFLGTGGASAKNCTGKAPSMVIVEIRSGDSIQLRRKALQVKSIVDQELGFSTVPSSSSQQDSARVETGEKDETLPSSLGHRVIFLCIRDKRVVGFCSVETISCAFRLLIQEGMEKDRNADVNEEGLQSEGTIHFISSRREKMKAASSAAPSRPRRPITSTYARSKEPTKAIMGVHQLWCHKDYRHQSIASRLVDAARSKMVYGMLVPHRLVAFSSPTAAGARFATKYSSPDSPLVYECRQ